MKQVAMLKHVSWRHGAVGGRIAIFANEDGYLTFKPIGGKNPPVEITYAILDAVLGRRWRRMAEELFRRNTNPWRVDVRQGMSGCRDLATRRLIDERFAEIKTTAVIHISMFWKVPGFSGYLGELAPILARLQELYPQVTAQETEPDLWEGELDGSSFEIKVLEPPSLRGFQSVDDTPYLGLWSPGEDDSCPEGSPLAEDSLPEIEIV